MRARTVAEVAAGVTIGLVSAWTLASMLDAPPPPAPVTTQLPELEGEDVDPLWNCLTDGNGVCGPNWRPLTAEQLRGITWSHDGYDDWQGCLTDGVTVVCDDGYVYVWVKVPADYAA